MTPKEQRRLLDLVIEAASEHGELASIAADDEAYRKRRDAAAARLAAVKQVFVEFVITPEEPF